MPNLLPEFQAVGELLESSCARHASNTATRMKNDAGNYRTQSYAELWNSAGHLAVSLAALGIKPGDRVAIQGENRPEWGISYLAAMRAGAVIVPVDATLGFKEVSFILGHSNTRVLFASRSSFNKVWKDNLASFPADGTIIAFDSVESGDLRVLPINDCLARGKALNSGLPPPSRPEALLEILYTSGTTGNPKAVMLSHRNIASDIQAIGRMFVFGEGDVFLSVLPIHHVFEGTVGFLTPLCIGASITYAESMKSSNLIANMRETGATIMLGVPLLYEKLYYGILRTVRKRPLSVRIPFHILLTAAKVAGFFGWWPGKQPPARQTSSNSVT